MIPLYYTMRDYNPFGAYCDKDFPGNPLGLPIEESLMLALSRPCFGDSSSLVEPLAG